MSDLTIACSVTRTRLPGSLAPLNLNNHTAFEVVSAGPGNRRWVREWATAPSVHGATEVSRRMDIQTAPLVLRALGSSAAVLNTNTAAMVAAFSQSRYNLTLTIDGVTSTWKCWAADITPGEDGELDKYRLAVATPRQLYRLAIPRHPIPVAGVM